LILPDNSDYKFTGKLSIIDRAVDPQTGTIKIRTLFPNPEKILRPGTNCKVKVRNEYSGNQIKIPFRAMVEQMGEYFVYLINSSDTVKQKRIVIGPIQGEFVLVKSGLNPGDRIVVDGLQKIHQGSVVVVSEVSNDRKTSLGTPDQNKGDKGADGRVKPTETMGAGAERSANSEKKGTGN
jgi:membrane fusion protein (multidrug efflux system)